MDLLLVLLGGPRFLYRLFREPRRLWRRYLVEYRVFLGRYAQLQWRRLITALRGGGKPGDSS